MTLALRSPLPVRRRVTAALLAVVAALALTAPWLPSDPEGAPSATPASPAPGADAVAAATVADLAFLAGAWQAEEGPGRFREEFWSPPRGGTMVGAGRVVRGEATRFIEFLVLERTAEEGLVYRVALGHRQPEVKTFRLVELEPGRRAVFAMPENDFPTSLRYERTEEGDLLVVLGGEQRGQAVEMPIRFRRAAE